MLLLLLFCDLIDELKFFFHFFKLIIVHHVWMRKGLTGTTGGAGSGMDSLLKKNDSRLSV